MKNNRCSIDRQRQFAFVSEALRSASRWWSRRRFIETTNLGFEESQFEVLNLSVFSVCILSEYPPNWPYYRLFLNKKLFKTPLRWFSVSNLMTCWVLVQYFLLVQAGWRPTQEQLHLTMHSLQPLKTTWKIAEKFILRALIQPNSV